MAVTADPSAPGSVRTAWLQARQPDGAGNARFESSPGDYQQHGLNPPQVVLDATKKYQLDSDVLARFLADEDAVCDGHGSVLSGQLYKAFMDWVRAQGEEVQMSNKAFTEAMELRGYKRSPHTKAGRLWYGLMLITPESSDR